MHRFGQQNCMIASLNKAYDAALHDSDRTLQNWRAMRPFMPRDTLKAVVGARCKAIRKVPLCGA